LEPKGARGNGTGNAWTTTGRGRDDGTRERGRGSGDAATVWFRVRARVGPGAFREDEFTGGFRRVEAKTDARDDEDGSKEDDGEVEQRGAEEWERYW
jgi:hypothetical protein